MNIIHVDDSRFALTTTKKFLKDIFPDCRVVSLTDAEYMDFVKNGDVFPGIDVAIVDLIMPVMNGHEVIKSLSKSSKDIFIIVLSSNVQSFEKNLAFENGANLFIEKPITHEKIEKIKEYFNG